MVEVLGDSSSLERAFARSGRAARGWGHDVESASRGALAASLSFRGIGRSLTFASAQFLGGAGIVFALKSTIQQAQESQRVLSQTENAVSRAGLSWQAYGDQVQKAALAQANVSGFDDERLLGTFSLFVRRTKDVNQALRLNALAANVARGRNIELEQAANLVLKASIGQAGALRRLGIDVKNGASSFRLLAFLQQKYAGSAAAFGKDSIGAQERFNVALGNVQERLGDELLPTVTKYLNIATDWLNNTENQKRLQDALGSAVSGTVGAIRTVATAAKAVSDALGGWKNTLTILISLKVASVFTGWATAGLKFAAALRAIRTAEEGGGVALLLRRIVGLGPASTTAGATGARAMAGIGAAAEGAAVGGVAALGASIAGIVALPAFITLFAFLKSLDKNATAGIKQVIQPIDRTADPFAKIKNNTAGSAFPSNPLSFPVPNGGTAGGRTGADDLADAARESRERSRKALLKALADQAKQLSDTSAATKKLLTGAQRISLAIQQARLAISRGVAGGQDDLIAALREQVALDRRNQQIQERLIARGVGNIKQHVEILNRLRADESGALDEIRSIQDERAAKVKQAAEDAKQRAKDAAAHAKELLQSRQFLALGLAANGEDRVPGVKGLRRQLEQVSVAIEGSFLDTRKTQGMLSRIRRVLSGGLGDVTRDVRSKIRDMIAALKDELGKADAPLTRFQKMSTAKLTAGLDLTRAQRVALRSRLSQVSPQGTVPARGQVAAFGVAVAGGDTFTGPIYVQGVHDVPSFVNQIEKHKARSRSGARRGHNAGRR